jgi:23S rRNA (pseudouridine1915-N3)-methyltransferase
VRWRIFAIGKPSLAYARDGVELYRERLEHRAQVEVIWLKSSRQDEESALLLARSEKHFRIVLDERGELFTSTAWAQRIATWEVGGMRDIAILIGGADGHAEAVRAAAGLTLALGKMTLQHELALVVLLEQLYRAYAIKSGAPYHR